MNTCTLLRNFVIFCVLFNLSSLSFAQGLQTKEIEVAISSTGAEARSEAFQKATENLSKELALSRLGKEFLEKNEKRFEDEVIAKSEKYILSLRSKSVQGSSFKVELSYSIEAFDRLLRESGLVQLSRQNLRALVLIEEKNQAVGAGPWWVKDSGEMKPLAKEAYLALGKELTARGIEVLSPQSIRKKLPSEFKKANLMREELVRAGTSTGVTLVYFGLVAPGSKGTIYHGQWIQVPAARILEELQGEAPKAQIGAKLIAPVKVAQAQGTLNTRPFLLTIEGDISPRQLDQLKGRMRSGVRDLRSMKERVIRQGKFTFEAESPQTPKALADILKTLSFQDFQHRVSLNGDDEILLRIEKR